MAEVVVREVEQPTENGEVVPEMTRAETIAAVIKQVEYYFSKENLQGDAFLTSQMDANMSVPISVVMKFAKMKKITTDEALFREALGQSSLAVIDNRIKANLKTGGRSTIILREIPSDASADEVKEIFNFDGCKPISSIKSEIGDMWYVVMESEQDAKDTILDLRMKKRSFRGASIKSRLKTESVVRSFYPVQSGAPMPVAPMYAAGPMMAAGPYGGAPMDMRAFGYMSAPGVPVAGPAGATGDLSQQMGMMNMDGGAAAAAAGGRGGAHGSGQMNSNGHGAAGKSSHKGGESEEDGNAAGGEGSHAVKARGDKNKQQSRSSNNSNTERGSRREGHGKGDKEGGSRRGERGDKKDKKEHAPQPVIEINAANFPPLSQGDDSAIPTPGYKGDFQKYSFEEIIAIVKDVKEAVLPPGIDPAVHGYAMTATANEDLLKRQRTFSIDETREQLKQGRPVNRQAVGSGGVDYRSMMFGDESGPAAAAVAAATATAAQQQPAATQQAAAGAIKAPTAAHGNKKSSNGGNGGGGGASWANLVKTAAATQTEPSSPTLTAATKPAASKPTTAPAAAKPTAADAGKKDGKTAAVPPKGGRQAAAPKSSPARPKGSGRKGRDDRSQASNDETQDDGMSESNEQRDSTSTSSAQTPVTWGGKASFANILKTQGAPEKGVAMTTLSNTSSTPEQQPGAPALVELKKPTAPAVSAPAPAAQQPIEPVESASSADSTAQKGPLSFAERAAAAAALPNPPAAAASTTKPRPATGATNTAAPAATATANKERRPSTGKASGERKPQQSSFGSSDNGANSSGMWVKATLPPVRPPAPESK